MSNATSESGTAVVPLPNLAHLPDELAAVISRLALDCGGFHSLGALRTTCRRYREAVSDQADIVCHLNTYRDHVHPTNKLKITADDSISPEPIGGLGELSKRIAGPGFVTEAWTVNHWISAGDGPLLNSQEKDSPLFAMTHPVQEALRPVFMDPPALTRQKIVYSNDRRTSVYGFKRGDFESYEDESYDS